MDCKCGQEMINMGKVVEEEKDYKDLTALRPMTLWSCQPTGCGRIYLEGSGGPMDGTWYNAEENEIEDIPGL